MMERNTPTSLEEEGRALVERLGGRWGRSGGFCRCPAHDDRTPSLSVRPGRRRLLLHCFAGCAAGEVLKAIGAAGHPLGIGRAGESEARCSSEAQAAGAALRLWGAARALCGTPAERYLAGRGLGAGDQELRYHPRAPLGPNSHVRFRPAMIAAVRDEAGLVAVQRTFLDPRKTGLASIAAPRRCLGRLGRGTVRLGGTGPRLGLAEGIETALSATILFGLPCWALLGSERFGKVALPAGVRALVLFLDHDEGGRRAEALARQGHGQLGIEVRRPLRPGADWNDVLRAARAGGAES